MTLVRRLIPPFLHRLDLWLQQRHPRLWSTRIHYHLWFLLWVNVLVLVLGLALRVDPRRSPEPEQLFAYMMFPAVVYFACWIYKVVLFTVERRFGIRHRYAEVGELLVHWVSILLILTIPYNLAFVITWRIGHSVDDVTFVEHVNTLNRQAPWFYGRETYEAQEPALDEWADAIATEVDLVRRTPSLGPWAHRKLGDDTHRFYHDLEEYAERDQYTDSELPRDTDLKPALHEFYDQLVEVYNVLADPNDTLQYDPDSAAVILHRIDSIETTFPLLCTFDHTFRPGHDIDHWFLSDSVLSVLYVADLRAHTPPDRAALARAVATAQVYSASVRDIGADRILAEFEQRMASTTGLHSARYPMGKVARAKAFHYDPFHLEALLYGVLLSCFGLAILISIFKNIYWQPFLIAVVVCILLPIVIFLFALLTEHGVFNADDGDIMVWCYYLIAVTLVALLFRVMSARRYSTTMAVTTILGNLVLPVIAVATLMILHIYFDVFGVEVLDHHIDRIMEADPLDPRLDGLRAELHVLREQVTVIMLTTLWSGVVVYTFLLHPLMRKLYTRLIALPERK